jgi:hypothetical protein
MEVANSLAYYNTATIPEVKRFIIQARGGSTVVQRPTTDRNMLGLNPATMFVQKKIM